MAKRTIQDVELDMADMKKDIKHIVSTLDDMNKKFEKLSNTNDEVIRLRVEVDTLKKELASAKDIIPQPKSRVKEYGVPSGVAGAVVILLEFLLRYLGL